MRHLEAVNRKAVRIADYVADRTSVGGGAPGAGAAGSAAGPAGGAADAPIYRQDDISAEQTQAASDALDVVALQQGQPPQQPPPAAHIPLGCSLVFSPGWEADRTGGTAGLCQPVERDLFDCHVGCYWPAQVPDQLNHAPDWTSTCAAAQKDWRKIDLVFP